MIRTLPAAALMAGLASMASAQQASDVVATVNGTEITLGEMIITRSQLPQQYQQLPPETLFQGILDQLVQQQVLADTLEDTPARVELALQNQRRSLLAGEAINAMMGEEVSEEELQAAYDEAFADAEATQEFNASHILVETEEEAQIQLDQSRLQLISWWTTPPSIKRRYETAFFIADCPGQQVVVDGEEADDYLWCHPGELVGSHQQGELALMPPTLVTLTELSSCATVADARAFYDRRPVPDIHPKISDADGRVCMLYGGDAGYDSADPKVPGARNRCYLENGKWRYEFSVS